MGETRTKDRRRAPRHDLSVPVQLLTAARREPVPYDTLNISEGGIFIATENPLSVSTEVTLVFFLSSLNASVRATGRVVRTCNDAESIDGPAGMAIEFEGEGKLGWHLLRKLMEPQADVEVDPEVEPEPTAGDPE